MKRCEFIVLIASEAGCPIAARAQQRAIPVIGYLSDRSQRGPHPLSRHFAVGSRKVASPKGRNDVFDAVHESVAATYSEV